MNADQITAIRQLKSDGKTIEQIAGQVGLEMGDVQTAVTMLDFMAGAGGGAASPLKVVKFDLAHDTPGLTDGVPVFTPKVGDLLLDAWVRVTEVWNGTTPKFDFGTFTTGFAGTGGLYASWNNAPDLSIADFVDAEAYGAGLPMPTNFGIPSLSALSAYWTAKNDLAVPAIPSVPQPKQDIDYSDAFLNGVKGARIVPLTFSAAHPFKVVVSQDGSLGGADPAATQGQATSYLLVVST